MSNATWFRVLMVAFVAATWGFAVWVGTHVSSTPSVLGRWSSEYFRYVAASLVVAVLATVTLWRPVYARLHGVRRGLAASLVAVVAALGLLEDLTRLLNPLGVSYYEESRRYHHDKVADPDLIYRHRANYRAVYEDVEYEFNSIGLRERPIGPKANGEFRILFLGDSVVLGAGVPIEKTFVRLLEGSTASRLGTAVRTINAGVGSYNSAQEFAFLKRHGEELDPDLVVLVYVDNDIVPCIRFDPEGDASLAGKTPPQVLERILDRSWLYRLVTHVIRYAGGHAPPPERTPGWIDSMAHVGAIADFCRERGISFAAFLWRFGRSPQTDALWDDLSAIAREKGFPLGDLQAAFEGHDRHAITNSAVDQHANAKGHEALARMMDGFLAAQDCFKR